MGETKQFLMKLLILIFKALLSLILIVLLVVFVYCIVEMLKTEEEVAVLSPFMRRFVDNFLVLFVSSVFCIYIFAVGKRVRKLFVYEEDYIFTFYRFRGARFERILKRRFGELNKKREKDV